LFSGSAVATKVRVGGAPATTVRLTVIVVVSLPLPLPPKIPEHVTVLPDCEQLKPLSPAAATKVTPVGGRSIRTCAGSATVPAVEGPVFVTIIVYFSAPLTFGLTGSGTSVIDTTCKSMPDPPTEVDTLTGPLLAVLVSAASTFTEALFEKDVVTPALTV